MDKNIIDINKPCQEGIEEDEQEVIKEEEQDVIEEENKKVKISTLSFHWPVLPERRRNIFVLPQIC